MRVKVHPDRMNLVDKTEVEKVKIQAEAAKVGQAADVLSDRKKVSSDILATRYSLTSNNSVESTTRKWKSGRRIMVVVEADECEPVSGGLHSSVFGLSERPNNALTLCLWT